MPAPPLRVAVIGLGAIGGIFAGWLGGLPAMRVKLSALARGETLHALRERGLRLLMASGERQVSVHASDVADDLGVQDLIIIAVKGPALAVIAPAAQRMMTGQTTVMLAMNGVPHWFFHGKGGALEGLRLTAVDPTGVVEACIPSSQVLGCVVHLSASTDGPALVQHVAGKRLILGEPTGGQSPRLAEAARLFEDAGFEISLSDRIQTDVWFKLWGNMTMNPISALTSATTDRILDDPLTRSFVSAIMLEAQAIGARVGCPIEQTPEDRHAVTRKLGPFKTSMLQDAERGHPLEIDVLLTAVREIGERVGVPTPNINTLLGLTRLMAQSRGTYG
jgi:2-dehydropantoate 2-reductase